MAEQFSVVWSELAAADLDAIIDHVAAEAPQAAERLLDALERRAASLETLPRRGRIVPELTRLHIREYRELIHGPYRVMYAVRGRRVDVLALIDARRDLQSLILERLLGGR